MNKTWIFILGIIIGVILTFGMLIFIGMVSKSLEKEKLTYFEERGECIDTDGELEVIQVIRPNQALATIVKNRNFIRDSSKEIKVLLIDLNNKSFYDKQKVKIPKDMCARQVGIYQYKELNTVKTFPAVVIE